MLKDYEIYADGFEGVAFFATAPNGNAAKADFYAWFIATFGEPYVGRHWADLVGHSDVEEGPISLEEHAMRYEMRVTRPATPPRYHLAAQNTDRP